MRSGLFMAGATSQNCLVSTARRMRQGSGYSAAGELEGARPASNEIGSFYGRCNQSKLFGLDCQKDAAGKRI